MPKAKMHAYFLYMLDYKRDEEARGVVFRNGLHDVQLAASPSWKAMTEEEKAEYKERAKRENQNPRHSPAKKERLSAQGVSLSILQRNQLLTQQAKNQMIKRIDKIINNGYINNTLPQQKFYFITVNYFVEMPNKFVVPAEIALCEFSLEHGVSNKYHSFINPGKLPYGLTFPAQLYTESTHKLPLPPDALGEKDFAKICCDIVQFTLSDENRERHPIYCREAKTDHVKSVLQQLAMEIGEEEEDCFEIYSLEYLFYALKKATTDYAECHSERDPFKNVFMAQTALDRDPFEYKTKIACETHEEIGNVQHCALSLVTRWAYQIADYCCLDMAISMIPGEHGPWDMDMDLVSLPVSTVSTKDIQVEDDDYDDDYDVDKKSNISFLLSQTNITQPKKELVKCNKEEFPSLSTISHTTPTNSWRKRELDLNCSSGSSNKSQETKIKDEEQNPWAIRNASLPRLPTEDSFSFSSIVSGRGRGIKAETEKPMVGNYSFGRGRRIY